MKLASFTDNSQSFLKYGDTNTFLHVQISEDGTFVDLTQALAVNVPVANDDGLLFTKTIDPTKLASGDSGIVDINFTSDDQNNLPPDDYYLEIWVTNHDGTIGIYPADENQLMFTITDNLTLITGDVVPAVAFDDFQNMFDTLQQQVQNAIANGLKGNTGDKGDPGEGLDIKGQVTSVSALPTTASEGDGYLVNEELYVYTSGAWKDCGPIQGPQGVQGIQGKTGTGVSSTTIQYQISNNATTAPTGTWSNTLIATTQVNPFLWTQVTLNYDDGTSKSFYLVSSKGDKGDKGDTGDIGPVGPVGPVGAGLVVKGTLNNASQLPKTGNQEGYCYFIGTDLYVWDAGTWKNCGSVSPDLSNYVTVTDLNNGLSTKVTDNKNGTEQLNGVQVQPFNKLSDTIGGRNLILGTQVDTVILSSDNNYNFTGLKPTTLIPGKVYTFSAEVTLTGSSDSLVSLRLNGPDRNTTIAGTDNFSADGNRHSWSFTCPTNTTVFGIMIYAGVITHTAGIGATWHHIKIEQGSIATDWSPAPEDKVNVTDMRKPASDVAGIEEVNAKQDKIGYTPADDSKVVHDNHDGTIQINGHNILPFNTVQNGSQPYGLDFNNYIKSGNYRFDNVATINYPSVSNKYWQLVVFGDGNSVYQMATGNHITAMRQFFVGSGWSSWMQVADDSKVAHLSGANNFDTIPTVNNNPLLLASSLPSDLARTGSDQEFTGKNTFDTAPIDKATGNPYITKDGVPAVPSTLADTTKDANFTGKLQKSGIDVATKSDVTTAVNTATANMVDSTKVANFTAGLQSGGVNVATAADLKSVEASAWRQLDNKYIKSSNGSIHIGTYVLYRLDTTNNRLLFMFTLNAVDGATVTVDFSSVVRNISTPTLSSFYNCLMKNGNLYSHATTVSGNLLNINLTSSMGYASSIYSTHTENNTPKYDFCFVNYDELV